MGLTADRDITIYYGGGESKRGHHERADAQGGEQRMMEGVRGEEQRKSPINGIPNRSPPVAAASRT